MQMYHENVATIMQKSYNHSTLKKLQPFYLEKTTKEIHAKFLTVVFAGYKIATILIQKCNNHAFFVATLRHTQTTMECTCIITMLHTSSKMLQPCFIYAT